MTSMLSFSNIHGFIIDVPCLFTVRLTVVTPNSQHGFSPDFFVCRPASARLLPILAVAYRELL